MSIQPRITIGIPVYNESEYIGECLDSILAQTYENFVVIVGDDCSTDNSAEIIKSYENKDKRVKYVKYPENKGLVHNFSFLIDAAETEFFALIGGHDILDKDYLRRCIEKHDELKNLAMVCSKVNGIDRNSVIDRSQEMYQKLNDDLDFSDCNSFMEVIVKTIGNLHGCYGLHGLYKTKVIQEIQFRDVICGDGYLIFSTLFFGDIYQIDEPLLLIREVRVEDLDQVMLRYAKVGIVRPNETFPMACRRLTEMKLKRVFESNKLNVFEKFKLAYVIYHKEHYSADLSLVQMLGSIKKTIF